jgi:hypothetical protein
MKRIRNGSIAWLLLFLTAVVPSAHAQQGDGPGRVIELDELVIEGKVAKPQVFYVLGRSKLKYKGLKLKKSFVDRIVNSVRQNPF